MAMTGFSGTTYEVQAGDGKRWTTDSVHRVRAYAVKKAEEVLDAGQCAEVRVTAKKDGWSRENVIFEQASTKSPKKALKVTPIEEAPICREFTEFYEYPARRTLGRLIRQYLDEFGITALELLFDFGRLKMLEHDDVFFPAAIQRLAGVQAKAAGEPPAPRIDELYRAFERIKDQARSGTEFEEYAVTLRDRGLDALIDEVKETVSPENRAVFTLGAMGTLLADGADWDDKLTQLIDLAAAGPKPEGLTLADAAIAEILDGAEAMKDIVGGQRDAVSGFRAMAQLAVGHYNVPKFARPSLAPLNDLLAGTDLPLTRGVLFERVHRGLGGIQPLTKEGREADREGFLTLLRDLTDPAGIGGGGAMCAAVVLRGKTLLGAGGDDLSLDQTIEQVLSLLPNRAVRLGFLLDLSNSDVGERHKATVLGALLRLVQQLTSMASLVPAGTPRKDVVATVSALRDRLGMGALPEDMRKAFTASLERLLKEGTGEAAAPARKDFTLDGGTRNMPSQQIERRKVESGQILFEEGDPGNEAYLVIDGEVEIFRKAGNRETVLATVGRGEVIGEMSLIDNQPRMASARILTDTEVVVVSQDGLTARLDNLESADRVLRRLIDVLVNRLRGQARTAE
jgi:hypothetical protein